MRSLNGIDTSTGIAATTDRIQLAVGDATDGFAVDTVSGRLEQARQHVHNTARVYPTMAAGVPIEAGDTVGGWDLGAVTQIIPATTIDAPYDLHWVNIENMTHNGIYELVLYAGDPDVEIARVRFARTDNFTKREALFVESAVIAADARVRGAVACSDAGAGRIVTVSLGYHRYG